MRTTLGVGQIVLLILAVVPVWAEVSPREGTDDAGPEAGQEAANTAKAGEKPKPGLEISGELKIRLEARRNADFDAAAGEPQDFGGQLVRLKFAGSIKDIKYVVEMMDGRELGAERQTGTAETTSLLQGYIELGDRYSLRLGRQEITLGKKRQIGTTGWGYKNLAAYDGLRLLTDVCGNAFDLFAVKIAEGATGQRDDTDLLGASYTWKGSKRWVPGLYVLFNHQDDDPDTPGDDATRMPIAGAIGSLNVFSGFSLDYELILQRGRRAGVDHRASLYHVGAKFTQPGAKRYWVGAAYNLASGDADPEDGVSNTFDKLYGINHSHYGYIDYQDPRNMKNLRLTLGGKLSSKLTLQLDYHTFELAEAADGWYSRKAGVTLSDPTGAAGKDVGSEVDVTVKIDLPTMFALELGYSRFLAGEFVETLQGTAVPDSNWAYAQLKAKF